MGRRTRPRALPPARHGTAGRDGARGSRARMAIAEMAARLLDEQPLWSCEQAKQRAALDLGLAEAGLMPGCEEVEAALAMHRRLFRPRYAEELRVLRLQALEAMQFLDQFSPRLVGALVTGRFSRTGPVSLHLFAESELEVRERLVPLKLVIQEEERPLRFRDGSVRRYPLLSFTREGIRYECSVLPELALREAPIGPGPGGVMDRWDTAVLARALEGAVPA